MIAWCVCLHGRHPGDRINSRATYYKPEVGPSSTRGKGRTSIREKCKFLLPKVEYLGYTISAEGLYPTSANVAAIKEAPGHTNLS